MDHLAANQPGPIEAPRVKNVPLFRPFGWLRRGFGDLAQAPNASLGYGLLFAAAGWLLIGLAWRRAYLVTTLVSGFFIAAPFLAMGLYDISRKIEKGGRVTFAGSLDAWRANTPSISLFGVLLAFILISWERISAIVFALSYGGEAPMVENFVAQLLFSGEYTRFVVTYVAIGAAFAAVVFAVSVVSVPMMLDRPVDPVTAIITSLRAAASNPGAMIVWALIIVVLTLIGFATWLFGLILFLPALGHASWHAYRDLVD